MAQPFTGMVSTVALNRGLFVLILIVVFVVSSLAALPPEPHARPLSDLPALAPTALGWTRDLSVRIAWYNTNTWTTRGTSFCACQ
jgi:hypothetical protein